MVLFISRYISPDALLLLVVTFFEERSDSFPDVFMCFGCLNEEALVVLRLEGFQTNSTNLGVDGSGASVVGGSGGVRV